MSTTDPGVLRRLPLHDEHLEAGARLAPFAGWEMPLQYAGVIAEHEAVRERAGVFDVSHMGRVEVAAPSAIERFRGLTTFDVGKLRAGEAHYSLYCTEQGGVADDIFVYRSGEQRLLIVHNAGNAAADFERVRAALPEARELTSETTMLAVQGPGALAILREVLGAGIEGLRPRRCVEVPWRGASMFVSRTGYTGEDGAECITSIEGGRALWRALLEAGVQPCGLAARDTLRLEAALVLHGHDIDESTNPYEAGLGWVVTLDDGAEFSGRNVLARLQEAGPPARQLACVRLQERAVPRAGSEVLAADGDKAVGVLTSGTFGPTLRAGIGMGYLPRALAEPGTPVRVRIRERLVPAEVVARPFYRRASR